MKKEHPRSVGFTHIELGCQIFSECLLRFGV